MFAPIRLVGGAWPAVVERTLGRFVWADPRVVVTDTTPEQFREAMKAFHFGGTYKITGTNRHPESDDLLVSGVDTTGADIVDIGASDGSTSADLAARLGDFSTYTIADLYLEVSHVDVGRRTVFFDTKDEPVLVVGPRLLAWPEMSTAVARLYARTLRRARRQQRTTIPLLNPTVRRVIAADPRMRTRTHDVFTTWPQPVDVVKVANLLRRLYFDDARLLQGLTAIHASLSEGGHLLLVDNPRIAGIDERGGLYRKEGGGFVTVAETGHQPEIADLVAQVDANR
ncbi:hypothetical protein SAMN04489867_2258 [Pedococcus dokdonensis]|uniref:Uncharacterized protein n=1 Tax=Pedococcus dokdonensis TaxID=443156 RepID=A0A1H0S953_9MICO|nr:hypothetical protein [Pedococcus dokdonensis]SDP38303.1 hypothetical protein SAMN04489867_2258 [Pedococcus dokdonensis]